MNFDENLQKMKSEHKNKVQKEQEEKIERGNKLEQQFVQSMQTRERNKNQNQ